jgi:integrase
VGRRDRYDDLIRIYIRPVFGDVRAAKLDAEMLERFYARLQRCRELCDGRSRRGHSCRPLTGSTVRQIHYISGALERAVRWRHLAVNKATLLSRRLPIGQLLIRQVPRRRRACSTQPGRIPTGVYFCG